jgi:hypothetical protein
VLISDCIVRIISEVLSRETLKMRCLRPTP